MPHLTKRSTLMRGAIAASVLVISALALTAANPKLKAYGHIVGNFSRLDIAGVMNVDCRHNPDSTGYVVFYTYPEFSKVLKVKNENGELRLWTDADDIGRNYFMNVIVYSGALDKIVNGSTSRVTISSIKLNRKSVFEINHNGSGPLNINTPITAKTMSLRNTGSGSLSAGRPLSTDNINLSLTGSGSIGISALSAVRVNISNKSSATIDIDNMQTTELKCINNGSGRVNIAGTAITTDIYNGGSGSVDTTQLTVNGQQ